MAETNYMRFDCIDDIVHHTLICAIMIMMEPKKTVFAVMHFGKKKVSDFDVDQSLLMDFDQI